MDSLQTISQNTLEIIESCKLIEYSLLSYICITYTFNLFHSNANHFMPEIIKKLILFSFREV